MFSQTIHPLKWYRDKKVTVVGLGAFGGGAGVTRFLAELFDKQQGELVH